MFKKFILKNFHTGHNTAHLFYFAAVAVEGHGVYAAAAGVLFIVTVAGWFLGEED